MNLATAKENNHFLEDLTETIQQRTNTTLKLGILLIPLFGVLDFIMYREFFQTFIFYRLLCSGLLIGLLVAHRNKICKTAPLRIALIEFTLIVMMISLMISHVGDTGTFYYAGIILASTACSIFLPLDMLQSLLSSTLFYTIFATPILFFSDLTIGHIKVLTNSSFFFTGFALINAVLCREAMAARVQEFNLRMQLDDHSKKLSFYAANLELEVSKRTRKLQHSETKYKQLFENMIDMVILINNKREIVLANPIFRETLGIDDNEKKLTLDQLIFHKDLPYLKEILTRDNTSEIVIKDINFRAWNTKKELLDLEGNIRKNLKNGITNTFQMVLKDITAKKRLQKELLLSIDSVNQARNATILGLAKLSEYRDKCTGLHLERMQEYTKIIAEEMATNPEYNNYITERYINDMYHSAILHDIGKVGVPDAVLLKPEKLTPEEFEQMKRHTVYGGDMLQEVDSKVKGQSFLSLGKTIAYHHHERWDGSGYPSGLKGKEIPLSTRCVAIADVYDALTSVRCYKKAFTHEEAKKIIIAEKGKQFDPDIVTAFLEREKEFERVYDKLQPSN